MTSLLAGLVGLLLGCLAFAAIRDPVARRLAFRQVARRRMEALLVTSGALLGTATLVGALVVGDTLTFSVQDVAYRTLGPVDERIVTSAGPDADALAAALQPLRADPRVDGMVTAQTADAAAESWPDGAHLGEPRALAWEFDFAAAAAFGGGGGAGLSGQPPGPGEVILNAPLAETLRASPGGDITLYLYGRPTVLRVLRVVPERGLAGVGFGATRNSNAYVAAGSLAAAAKAAGGRPRSVTFISNLGDVRGGETLTSPVTAHLRALTARLRNPVSVDAPKHVVLGTARQTGRALSALFLLVGSFSVIAGVLLLINVVVMLGAERKPQWGIMRAVGLKRSRLVVAMTLEGTGYGLLAALIGTGLGVGVGRATVLVADRVFRSLSVGGSGVRLTFAMTPTSLVRGALAGLAVAVVTVVATSARLSLFPVAAAIRGLPAQSPRRPRRLVVVGSVTVAVALGALAIPPIMASDPLLSYLLPAGAVGALAPVVRRVLPRRGAHTLLAGAVLGVTLTVSLLRPRIYDSPAVASYVLVGCLLTVSAVVLVSENQQLLLRPLRPLIERSTSRGLATRLAVAYPLAQRFRTGATVLMIALMVFTLVLVSEVDSIVRGGTQRAVAHATAGYALRVDYSPHAGTPDPANTLQAGPFHDRVLAVVPVLSAFAHVLAVADADSAPATPPLEVTAVGVPTGMSMAFAQRMPQFADDRAVWDALATDGRYVAVDGYFGADTVTPAGRFRPGSTMVFTDPGTGRATEKVVAGTLESGVPFYSATGGVVSAFPVVMSDTAWREQFGKSVQAGSALLRVAPTEDADRLAAQLQGAYLADNLVATPVGTEMNRRMAAETGFLQLMQGFLCLGLLVGIVGLGVVMIRAVRERRRTIGALRALGVRSSAIRRSFLIESALLALEGTLVGAVLAVVTAWLLYRSSPLLDGLRAGFPISWAAIGTVAAVVVGATLLATLGSAARAAGIQPARAIRILD